MNLESGDLSLEWRTIQQQTLSSVYSLNFNFKVDQNVKLTKKKKRKLETLASNQYFLTQLIELLNKLNYQINWLFEKGKQHDHTGKQVNGYYSMIKILLVLLKLICKKVIKLNDKSSLRTETTDMLNVLYYFVLLIDQMILMFDYKINSNNQPLNEDSKNLFSYSIDNFSRLNLLSLQEDAQRALSAICGPVGVFWYSKSMKNVFKAFRFLLIGSTSNPFRSLHCILSKKECGRNLARKCSHSTVEYVSRSLSVLELKVYNRIYFSLINLNKALRYTVKTVHIKVSTSLKVPLNNVRNVNNNQTTGEHVQLVSEENQRKVRCRLISGFTKSFIKKYCNENNLSIKEIDPKTDINRSKCVIFHVHGGGFCVTSPDSHEIYLRKWATKLNGTPILSVDYQLRAAYPRAIQDVLDVYLKLFTINTADEFNKAEKLFGFIPENVILVGDSCGGSLILSLLCCLNDIRREQLIKSKIIMPFALTAIYPVFDLRCVCSASKFIGLFDPILSNANIMAMHGSYGSLSPNSINCNSIVNRIKNRHVKPWFLCTDEQCATANNLKNKDKPINENCPNKHVENRFIQMNEHLDGPFASPVTYKHFEDFKDIKMNLIATNICPLLDDAVEMYRMWPGNKMIHIFDSLPHGFIQFIDLSPSCKKACKQIVHIINSSIEDICTKLNQPNDINNNETVKQAIDVASDQIDVAGDQIDEASGQIDEKIIDKKDEILNAINDNQIVVERL